jgi:hypothetical protein
MAAAMNTSSHNEPKQLNQTQLTQQWTRGGSEVTELSNLTASAVHWVPKKQHTLSSSECIFRDTYSAQILYRSIRQQTSGTLVVHLPRHGTPSAVSAPFWSVGIFCSWVDLFSGLFCSSTGLFFSCLLRLRHSKESSLYLSNKQAVYMRRRMHACHMRRRIHTF